MQVEHCVDSRLCADINYSVEKDKPFGLEHAWVHVVFKVVVMERNAKTVESKRFVELGIGLGKEVLEKLVKVRKDL